MLRLTTVLFIPCSDRLDGDALGIFSKSFPAPKHLTAISSPAPGHWNGIWQYQELSLIQSPKIWHVSVFGLPSFTEKFAQPHGISKKLLLTPTLPGVGQGRNLKKHKPLMMLPKAFGSVCYLFHLLPIRQVETIIFHNVAPFFWLSSLIFLCSQLIYAFCPSNISRSQGPMAGPLCIFSILSVFIHYASFNFWRNIDFN